MQVIGHPKRKPRTRKKQRRPGKKKRDTDRRVYESLKIGFQVGTFSAIVEAFDTYPQLLHRQKNQVNVKSLTQALKMQNNACG
tara:strand:- start:122 stop:370 length:249 start_codon:yes stop_codon:yes gene_type:complete